MQVGVGLFWDGLAVHFSGISSVRQALAGLCFITTSTCDIMKSSVNASKLCSVSSEQKRFVGVIALYSILSIIRARIIRFPDYPCSLWTRKKIKEKYFHAYHACKIDVDIRSRDSFRETSEP
ncbi:hypothetical protein AVEN_128296-1 [Araneus ventricosus]|uniref:Uncharacterized protein n=1 Tax=Araneus ventricosus TaxID=182803 RepID=A0A4Y2K3N7_ARAVE|nr:hypothetical protein AVEN_128296-1 [Araneus ventricosus]